MNGKACPPLGALLGAVAADRFWDPVIRPRGRQACHGDLILEDVVAGPGPRPGIRLVDPNPCNQHGVSDLAKTMLSLWIGHEFIYFDFFRARAGAARRGDGVGLELELGAGHVHGEYAAAAARSLEHARAELAPELGLPGPAFARLILMAAALAALAIPAFHSLGHQREDRALAFLALGVTHASHALAGECPPPLPS